MPNGFNAPVIFFQGPRTTRSCRRTRPTSWSKALAPKGQCGRLFPVCRRAARLPAGREYQALPRRRSLRSTPSRCSAPNCNSSPAVRHPDQDQTRARVPSPAPLRVERLTRTRVGFLLRTAPLYRRQFAGRDPMSDMRLIVAGAGGRMGARSSTPSRRART